MTLEDAGRRQLVRESFSLRRRCSLSWRGQLISGGGVVFGDFLTALRGMGDSIVCLSRGEVALFLFPVIMFTLFIMIMCCVTKRQCREDGLRV